MTRQQIAKRLGVTYNRVAYLITIYGLNAASSKWADKRNRNARLLKQIEMGMDAATIGKQHGITARRVHQIARQHGIPSVKVVRH